MGYSQIYAVVNKIKNNLAYTGADVVDISTFVAFGQEVLSNPNLTEGVYNELVDMIGKTIFAIDEAEDDERGIIVDSFEYGSILQKLSFALQNAQTSSEYDISNPENPYAMTAKSGVIQKFFEQVIPAFSYQDVAYDVQLREAFRSPESLNGFIDALYQRMYNAYRIAKNGLSDAAVGGLMGAIMEDCAPSTDSHVQNVNASRRVRYLLGEYNTKFSKSLTADESLQDADYLDWVRKQIIIDRKNMNKMNKLYNDGSVERRTPEDSVKLDLSIALTASYDKYYGDTYHDNYVKLPKHTEIVNWGIATQPQTVKVSLDGTATTTIQNVLGVMYDKDAVVATLDRERFVAINDTWNDRTVFKLTANRRYIVDISENAVIYLNATQPS